MMIHDHVVQIPSPCIPYHTIHCKLSACLHASILFFLFFLFIIIFFDFFCIYSHRSTDPIPIQFHSNYPSVSVPKYNYIHDCGFHPFISSRLGSTQLGLVLLRAGTFQFPNPFPPGQQSSILKSSRLAKIALPLFHLPWTEAQGKIFGIRRRERKNRTHEQMQ